MIHVHRGLNIINIFIYLTVTAFSTDSLSRKFMNTAFEDKIAKSLGVDTTLVPGILSSFLDLCSFEAFGSEIGFLDCQARCVANETCLAWSDTLNGNECGHCMYTYGDEIQSSQNSCHANPKNLLVSIDVIKQLNKGTYVTSQDIAFLFHYCSGILFKF